MSEEINDKLQEHFYTIDIGVNFAGRDYKDKKKLKQIIDESYNAGVENIITITNCLNELETNIDIAKTHAQVYYTVGCHPHNAKSIQGEKDYKIILDTINSDPKCVAIGECGLDYNRMFSPKDVQKRVFIKQIEIAKRLGKPLYMHCRDAFDDFIEILRNQNYFHGVVHCFTGSAYEAQQLTELGFYLGITGWLFDDRRNHELIAAVKIIPEDRILVETDAPWLSIQKGRKSHPADTGLIVQRIAELKRIDQIELGKNIYQNTKNLFKI